MFWPDNIVELFQRFEVREQFDLLSVDMDSYDWFILEAVLEAGFSPRVIIIECNTMFELEDSKSIRPPGPGQTWSMWDGTRYQVNCSQYCNIIQTASLPCDHDDDDDYDKDDDDKTDFIATK